MDEGDDWGGLHHNLLKNRGFFGGSRRKKKVCEQKDSGDGDEDDGSKVRNRGGMTALFGGRRSKRDGDEGYGERRSVAKVMSGTNRIYKTLFDALKKKNKQKWSDLQLWFLILKYRCIRIIIKIFNKNVIWFDSFALLKARW